MVRTTERTQVPPKGAKQHPASLHPTDLVAGKKIHSSAWTVLPGKRQPFCRAWQHRPEKKSYYSFQFRTADAESGHGSDRREAPNGRKKVSLDVPIPGPDQCRSQREPHLARVGQFFIVIYSLNLTRSFRDSPTPAPS